MEIEKLREGDWKVEKRRLKKEEIKKRETEINYLKRIFKGRVKKVEMEKEKNNKLERRRLISREEEIKWRKKKIKLGGEGDLSSLPP